MRLALLNVPRLDVSGELEIGESGLGSDTPVNTPSSADCHVRCLSQENLHKLRSSQMPFV